MCIHDQNQQGFHPEIDTHMFVVNKSSHWQKQETRRDVIVAPSKSFSSRFTQEKQRKVNSYGPCPNNHEKAIRLLSFREPGESIVFHSLCLWVRAIGCNGQYRDSSFLRHRHLHTDTNTLCPQNFKLKLNNLIGLTLLSNPHSHF